jgi:hypothetical protein
MDYGKIAREPGRRERTLGARSVIGNFFLIAGIGFTVVGAFVWITGGLAGSIVGLTFTMIGVIWTLVALGLRGFYGGMAKRAKAEQQLFETGTKATAVVEGVETTGMVLNNINQQIILRLRVQPRGAPEFIHERKMFVPFNGIPRTGDLIDVAYDPSDQSTVALATDWRSNTAGGRLLILRSADEAAPTRVAYEPGVTPSGASDDRTAPERVIEQLERLNRLKEEGVLTESEFAVQKAKVLSGQDV